MKNRSRAWLILKAFVGSSHYLVFQDYLSFLVAPKRGIFCERLNIICSDTR